MPSFNNRFDKNIRVNMRMNQFGHKKAYYSVHDFEFEKLDKQFNID